ncbi:MAG: hypothetical protein ABSF26_13695 [Thermoguttaceae bacterium]|jgi:hypothetical protein
MPSQHDRTGRFLAVVACLGLGLAVLGLTDRAGAEPGGGPTPALPFRLTVTPEKLESLPDYMGPKNPVDMDFPYCPVMIDGEYWIIYKNGYNRPVFRFKGTNIENATRQADGSASFPLRAPYILGGVWYDEAQKRLYAPMHCEQEGYAGMVLREIHLASSTDKGLTWKYEGRLLTRDDPPGARKGPDFSGLAWDGGDGDHVIYVDKEGGYIYLFTNHYTWPKTGSPAAAFLRHRVARCAIADKMAPGTWQKFYNAQWSQPGVGGKASYVNGYCVMYDTYLKKYLSFNYISGLSMCDDLAKQDWGPSCYLGPSWCSDTLVGTWATNEAKTDTHLGGRTLLVYAFWQNKPGRRFRVELGPGRTAVDGFVSPSVYLITPSQAPWAVTAEPGPLYGYTPLFESADPIESRRTRRVSSTSTEMSYKGQWTDEPNKGYYDGQARVGAAARDSVAMAFQGADIYWRAVRGPDCGKADVFLDGALQKTVDCYANVSTTYQFGFIKTGLDATAPHTIKVVVRGDKNPASKGAAIKHMLFEYAAESYRASDGYSSLPGKNQWHNQERIGGACRDMTFRDPNWKGDDTCEIGYFQMTPGVGDAVRKWVAPHAGTVRVEGRVSLANQGGAGVKVAILRGTEEIWPTRTVKEKSIVHDLTAGVAAGQSICFVVSKRAAAGDRAVWDPVVTYVRGEARN